MRKSKPEFKNANVFFNPDMESKMDLGRQVR